MNIVVSKVADVARGVSMVNATTQRTLVVPSRYKRESKACKKNFHNLSGVKMKEAVRRYEVDM